MKLFETHGTLIVAKNKKDAFQVMREEWGEVFPVKPVRRSIEMITNGENKSLMRPSEIVKTLPRGLVPEG